MRWRDALEPVGMARVAILAPDDDLRAVLVAVADEGTVDLGEVDADGPAEGGGAHTGSGRHGPASERLTRLRPAPAASSAPTLQAVIAGEPPDLDRCEEAGRFDVIAGEAELERRRAQTLTRHGVAGLVGWMPTAQVDHLSHRLAPHGGAVAVLARPRGIQPPTLLGQSGSAREFAPLVDTYATVPYADINPSLVAGLAYVVMFGMMFADVGQGALLVLLAVAVRRSWSTRLARLRPVWLFLVGAGAASMVFGALYGEFFGPTGVIPTLWLDPLSHPVELLVAGVAAGAVLLAGAYALGTVNRFREGGWRRAVYAPSGLAGAALFLGLGAVAAGAYLGVEGLVVVGVVVAVAGLAAAYVGLFVAAGGGGAGAAEAGVGLFDLVLRLGSNLVSFARLAASVSPTRPWAP
jgi:V/A-type H+-transporting ATPase subunit I